MEEPAVAAEVALSVVSGEPEGLDAGCLPSSSSGSSANIARALFAKAEEVEEEESQLDIVLRQQSDRTLRMDRLLALSLSNVYVERVCTGCGTAVLTKAKICLDEFEATGSIAPRQCRACESGAGGGGWVGGVLKSEEADGLAVVKQEPDELPPPLRRIPMLPLVSKASPQSRRR
jgi:hypothetical protein